MILVLLGTQDKSFERLLKSVDEEIKKGNIKEKVIAQVGHTKYESKNIEMFDLIPRDEMDKLIDEASLIITHGGVGFITDSIIKGKKIIASPRLKKYEEHTNDHQLQIIKEFSDLGYLLPYYENDSLEEILNKIKKFKPKKYKKNNKIVHIIEDFINENTKGKKHEKRKKHSHRSK
ncbi:MAG: exopolysaccharide biosynthesis protein [Bacilli bacterium]|nr:exopolysaccharide biosynthesis protein [Bacilli bacterium]